MYEYKTVYIKKKKKKLLESKVCKSLHKGEFILMHLSCKLFSIYGKNCWWNKHIHPIIMCSFFNYNIYLNFVKQVQHRAHESSYFSLLLKKIRLFNVKNVEPLIKHKPIMFYIGIFSIANKYTEREGENRLMRNDNCIDWNY